MYIWQFEYSSYSNPELPLLAYEVKNSWDEKKRPLGKSAGSRWCNTGL